MQFSSLNLSTPILDAVSAEGYETPTPIQAKAIPPALDGRDVLGCAQTGTGKTAAFALPILQHLADDNGASGQRPARRGRGGHNRRAVRLPRALILSPTRELATQIGDAFATYGSKTGLTHTVIFGGVSQGKQERALMRAPDIIVATPGRLIDLMEQGLIDLSEVNHFVLDEADRMLDMGFIQPIRRIAKAIPTERQTLLFSATMPREIMSLADSLMRNPVKVAVTPVASAAPLIKQSVYMVARIHKQALLEHVLAEDDIRRALVFTRTKHGADRVAKRLARAGIAADAIHGNKSQGQRERALNAFRSGRARVLVATDVAARGIDVDAISHVFNYDLPAEPESYIHRIGRTGRAGATGLAIAFCDNDEREHLRAIEKLTGDRVPVLDRPKNLKAPVRDHEDDRPRRDPAPRRGEGGPKRGARRGGGGGGGGAPQGQRSHSRSRTSEAPTTSVRNASPAPKSARSRVHRDSVPTHPSGPQRAGKPARNASDERSSGPVSAPAAKPARGPFSQRTRRTRSAR